MPDYLNPATYDMWGLGVAALQLCTGQVPQALTPVGLWDPIAKQYDFNKVDCFFFILKNTPTELLFPELQQVQNFWARDFIKR
jgi:hypothetical protein